MVMVKFPAVAAAVVCSACVAAAMAVPDTTSADRAATSTSGVQLSAINFGNLDLLSAVPSLVALLGGDQSALGNLDSTSAIPAYVALAGGDVSALGGLDSTSAIPAYVALASGDQNALGGLDSTSAVPLYAAALDPTQTVEDRANAVRGLAAFSAIPEYLGLPSAPAPPPTAAVAPELKKLVQETAPAAVAPELKKLVQETAPAAVDEVQTVAADLPAAEKPENVQGDGNFGKFEPKPIVLFGSGAGNGGGGEGMRGYGAIANNLRAALGLGPDTSTEGAGGDPGSGG